jgi:pimeloyl-ACP methyl ester carboxylesterase
LVGLSQSLLPELSMHRLSVAALFSALLAFPILPSSAAAREPYGIALEGFAYPYPVSLLPLVNDGERVTMAYMDVAPAQPNGRTVVLLHGRNFPSSYWAPVIRTLSEAGYRVVVPDQIGFGKSSKPQGELHFDTLARNTITLLDHLQIAKADIVAHSLGGMLGVRIARAFPDRINQLILTAPIGLEDYRIYVPPTPTDKIIENEDKLTAEGYRKQLETNYALKLPADQVHHGRRRPQRAGQAQRAGSAAAEDGPECRARQSAICQNAEWTRRSDSGYRASGLPGGAGKI